MTKSRIYVCEQCIEDPDLQQIVRQNVISEECDYCGRKAKEPIACELCDVLERMRFAVDQSYTDPRNFVSWDGREGGWQGHPVHDGRELFENIGWYVDNGLLMDDIVHAFFDQEYADEDYWPGPFHERQMSSWERFKDVIKHERRYTFWSVEQDERLDISETQPSDMLRKIGWAVHFTSLIRTMNPGAALWRIRVHARGKMLNKASDFSSPPHNLAIYPNRMSPSGIPMFYGADDFDTAVAETADSKKAKGKYITGATFQNVVPLNILDLAAIPEPKDVGFFNDWTRVTREAVNFLRAITGNLSQPVKKDGSEHTEYVPTQVFTEFIRYELKTPNNEPFHGIRFPSSKNDKGCYVIFADQDECLPQDTTNSKLQILSFDPTSLKTISFNEKSKPK